LARARADALTYRPTGISLGGETPNGLQRRHWTTRLRGNNAFALGRAALDTWAVHRGAGLVLAADGLIAAGTNVAFSAPLPMGFVDGTCRIVAVVDDPDRYGFAYGTLGLHPETGEESFLVVREQSGDVRFDVEGVSRPTQTLARLVPPIAHRLQDSAVRRYLSAMENAVARAD
jgi:uncharacterized protein (UPF0548 family)